MKGERLATAVKASFISAWAAFPSRLAEVLETLDSCNLAQFQAEIGHFCGQEFLKSQLSNFTEENLQLLNTVLLYVAYLHGPQGSAAVWSR